MILLWWNLLMEKNNFHWRDKFVLWNNNEFHHHNKWHLRKDNIPKDLLIFDNRFLFQNKWPKRDHFFSLNNNWNSLDHLDSSDIQNSMLWSIQWITNKSKSFTLKKFRWKNEDKKNQMKFAFYQTLVFIDNSFSFSCR